MKSRLITFSEFTYYIEQISNYIKNSLTELDYLVSIQRGGALMSLMLSDLISLPIATLTISSYKDGQKVNQPILTQRISTDLANKNILLLDEISDTGSTLKQAVKHLATVHPKSIHTATMFTKSHSEFIPDFYIENEDRWIVFPYELKETLGSPLMDDVEEKDKIIAYFKSCGYSDKSIERTLHETGH